MAKGKKTKPPELTWRERLSAITSRESRTKVELSMLIEHFPRYFHTTQRLQYFTYLNATLNIQCVIYEEILYIIKHYPAWDRPYLDADVEAVLRQAVEEAGPFLKARNPIPLELTAQLIKLRVIVAVQEHAYSCSMAISERTSVSTVGSGEASSIFTEEELSGLEEPSVEQVYDTAMTEYTDEDVFVIKTDIDEDLYERSSAELRGYIERLRSRREEFLKRSSSEKPVPRPSERILTDLPKDWGSPWSVKHSKWKKEDARETKSAVFDEEERRLHLILTGFYEPGLVEELAKVGLPMTCLIGITKDGEVPTLPEEINLSENADGRRIPIYNYALHDENPKLRNFLNTSYYHDLVLFRCYEGFEELFDSEPTLQDIVYFRCEPAIATATGKLYDQGKEVYERVSDLIGEIPRLRILHADYLKRIELRRFGPPPKPIPTSQMSYYNASLNRVPPDCFSVSLLLNGLLEEVCASRNAAVAEKQRRTKISKKYSKFERPSVDLRVDLSGFVVHEKNVAEMSLRYYPQVKKKLLDVKLACLELSRPALLWRKYPKTSERSRNEYLTWAGRLRLSPEDLGTCLEVYLFSLLACPEVKDADATCDVQKYFRNPFKTSTTDARVAAVVVEKEKVEEEEEEEKTPDLRWQEDLSRKMMLQEVRKASLNFTCMDHVYVPPLNVILLRFHNNSDDFGVSTKTWNEVLRAPVGLHDFYKWVVHQDEEASIKSTSFRDSLVGYDFDRWRGINGTSTLFRSSEAFSVRVDKEWCFKRAPVLSVFFETRGHSLNLNTATSADGFMFHFLLANGCRVLFAKPTGQPPGNCEGYRRRSAGMAAKRKPICYLVRKTSYARFKDRDAHCKAQLLLTRISLKRVLRRSLNEIDSQSSIALTSKPSTTAIRKDRNRRTSKRIRAVFDKIKAFKRALAPRFKICSSILHRFKYVKVVRERLTVNFANITTTIKFIPHVKLKHRVEISPCFYLPPQNLGGQPSNLVYDVRVSLPSGLQVQTRSGKPPHAHHVVQYYATAKGPTCKNIENEVSRTYLRSGFVCIKYADGTLKMLGANGSRVKCEAPFVAGLGKRARRRKQFELIERYQGKFVDGRLRRFKGGWKKRFDPEFEELCAKLRSADQFVVTGDGRKFSASKRRRRAGVKIEFEVCGDGRERKAGAHTSINQNGELTTVYPDGTRITSWYRIEQEMVLVADDPLSGELEIDEDDYFCNFLIPRRDGWISVQLFYQFEHPNYVTVIYGGGENGMQLKLPNRTELDTQRKGYSLNVKEQLFADIFATSITLHSNFCRKCYDSCVTKLNVEHLYEKNSKPVPTDEYLLVANDNFGKVFRVMYDGKWHCNADYKPGKNKHDCLTHRKDEAERFFAWKRDLSGKVFWNQDMYLNRMMVAQYGKMQKVKYYLDDKGELIAYEFLKYVQRHYCRRFLMDYGPANTFLFNLPKPNGENLFKTIAFTKRRLIKILPDCERNGFVHATDVIRPSFTAEDFARCVDGIQERAVFNDRPVSISRERASKEGKPRKLAANKVLSLPKTGSFIPVTPTNSLKSSTPCQSVTDQINRFVTTIPKALLIQDDFISEVRSATTHLSSNSDVLKLGRPPRPKYKDESTETATRFDLFRDDRRIAPGETSSPPATSECAKVHKKELRKREFICREPTRIEPPVKRPETKATSTATLEAFCKCRRFMRDFIPPDVTREFVKNPRPDPATLRRMQAKCAKDIPAVYKRVIKCKQKFYKQLEHELAKVAAEAQVRSINQDLSHLRRDSWESVASRELQSTLPMVLPASTSEDSCKILFAPKSAVVTKSERKFARPFRPAVESKEREDEPLEDSHQQIDNLTPQSFDVFVKALRRRLGKIEEVDSSEDVRKIGERFDLLIAEKSGAFPKKIAELRDLLKLLRASKRDVDSMQSSTTDTIV